jgi:hypothetical protein
MRPDKHATRSSYGITLMLQCLASHLRRFPQHSVAATLPADANLTSPASELVQTLPLGSGVLPLCRVRIRAMPGCEQTERCGK